MDYDREIPYSVLTRDEVSEKMKKQINDISEIFLVSKSDATVLLMSLRWDLLRVSERLSENKEKSLVDSGLKPDVIDTNLDSCSEISFETDVYEFEDDDADDDDNNDDDGDLISTPFCSHKFGTTYWTEYLEKNFYSVETVQTAISCPDENCRSAVGPDTIEKLTQRDQEMYERYVLRSYIEGNKVLMIKECPATDCNYVIEFHQENYDDNDEYSLNVVCLCGHIFCWRCKLESHRPVTCNNASDWLCRDTTNLSDESFSLPSININTKIMTCPHCLCPVESTITPQFLTCICRLSFCSRCLRSKEDHKFGSCVERDVGISCEERWGVCQNLLEQAKSDLEAFEESNTKNPSDLKEQDIMIIREGLMLIVQCRRVLKWCCVYDYFHTEYENSKKEYLQYLQENATVALQNYSNTLQEQKNVVLTSTTYEECSFFRHTIPTATSNIGNYFYHFIKTLQDGLVDVKVMSYNGGAGPFWYCDRCTYGNTWIATECEMCSDDISSLVEELSDFSLNKIP
ncbi:PREDICTED: probable E3 ubiquitin-protein ligase ARI14 [Camelina sativa]|uniref:RBR-type E3 ubiquitin transferase n=1 Tax=Camelina sativa TaxID=90675 RepID=A0ABM0XD27_CAMSA|nr:PREDICTED: probable E3 ubiquitin-protein ligase ARI14 [Camelina sativa]